MKDIEEEFKQEALSLLDEMTQSLEAVEKDLSRVDELERFGNLVDRIMGGAKNLSMMVEDSQDPIHGVAAHSEICKLIAYKASQIRGNKEFLNVVVAFLLDATEFIQEMVPAIHQPEKHDEFKSMQERLLDRLNWIAQHFPKDFRASVALEKKSSPEPTEGPDDLEKLLEQMGLSGKVS